MAARAGAVGSIRRDGCVAIFVVLVWMLVATGSAEAAVLPTTISENTTLTASGGTYTGTSVTVASGATLTIEPGSVIKISGALIVNGVLTVNGTAEAPVTFTSKKDDSVGGDTNGDGSATIPKAGDWSGIEFPASTGGSIPSMLNYARLLYGGTGGTSPRALIEIKCPCANPPEISHSYLAHSPSNGVKVSKGSPSITSSTIEDSAASGISATSSSPHIYGNTISGNNIGISFSVASNDHGSVDINNNLVEGNKGTGISVSAGTGSTHIDSASLGNNVVKGNGGKAINYEAFPNSSESSEFTGNPIPPNITTNVLSGNAKNGIWVGGRIAESTTWEASGYPLVVFNNGLNIGKGSTLALGPGLVIKDEGRSIFVNGALHSEGTAESPVTITSVKDDSIGGDTNGDGSATAPAPGDWRTIEFVKEAGASIFRHTNVRYGGETVSPFHSMVEIYCPCLTQPQITDSTFANSAQSGVNIHKGSPVVTGNTIEANVNNGIVFSSGAPEVRNNTISGNNIGISFSVASNEHGSVDINNNLVEGNKGTGISVSAGTGSTHIDSASLGNNVVKGNGGKAINYEAFPNSSESAEFVGNPIPPNITTNTISGNAKNGIWVGGRVAESTTWEASGYPLVVFNNGLNIGKGSTLTLGPGTIVKDENRSIFVNGAVHSEGTAESPVTITSVKDDSVGGDTNGDGSATAPAPGDWRTIEFPAEAGPSSLAHTKVLYGGESVYPFESMIEVHCPCVNPLEFTDSTIAYSYMSGINIHKGAAPSITGSTIAGNLATGVASSSSSPHIYGNTISGNNIGISFSVASNEHGSVDINNNLVEGNKGTGISVSAGTGSTHIDSASMGNNVVKGNGGKAISYLAFPNGSEGAEFVGNPIPANITTNILEGNKENGIWVGGRIAESTTWEASGYPLVVFNNGLNIGKGSTLALGPGLVIKDEGRSIFVNGALHSEGTAESPVTITSVKDDSIGGDTNGDGSATAPAPGDWGEIQYPDSKEVELEYMDIRYAEIAFNLKYLDSMTIANSDFVYNEKAFQVAQTANNSPELSALSCVPPYLSFVVSAENWYGATGLPAPSTDISGAVGAVLPVEYSHLFDAAASLGELDASLYGTDNTIPFSIYSCSALGIPPTPVTPVFVTSTPLAPHFPDPEVE